MNKDNEYYREALKMQNSLQEILILENDLNSMVMENVLDIYVDEKGTFLYKMNDEFIKLLPEFMQTDKIEPTSFKDLCISKGVDPVYFNMFERATKSNFFR
jgi:hypothetical protein